MPDRYEFIRKIAQGGFGHVYLAKDKLLGREHANDEKTFRFHVPSLP